MALKIGFVGYGRHAKMNLYPSLKALGYQIAAVATKHDETAKQASLDYNIPSFYSDYQKMFAQEKLDCVLIATRADAQLEITKAALEAGLHVFVEKPLGFNARDAKDVATLAEKMQKLVQVGFMFQFAPMFQKAREIIQTSKFGEFGKIVSVQQTYNCRNFTTSSRDFLLFGPIHFLNFLTGYLGKFSQANGQINVEGDSIYQSFSLQADNGAVVSVHYAASPVWAGGVRDIVVTGENGYLKLSGIDELSYRINEQHNETPRWQLVDEKETKWNTMLTTSGGGQQNLYLNGFIGEIEHFLKNVENSSNPKTSRNTAAENILTMELFDQLVTATA